MPFRTCRRSAATEALSVLHTVLLTGVEKTALFIFRHLKIPSLFRPSDFLLCKEDASICNSHSSMCSFYKNSRAHVLLSWQLQREIARYAEKKADEMRMK